MSVRYVGPHDAVEVSGKRVERNEAASFDADVEKSLCEQRDWQPVKSATSKKES